MATHSSILTWRIPGTEEPDGLLFIGSHRLRHDWSDLAANIWCILAPCYNHLLVPFFFFHFSTLRDFLHRQFCCLGTMAFLFLFDLFTFPPFYCLNGLIRISSKMLSRSSERTHPCLFSVRGKFLSFSQSSMM